MTAQQGASLFDAALRAFPLLRDVDSRGHLVGGAVRDLVLGRIPRDADVAILGAAEAAERFAARAGGRMVRLGAAPLDVIRVAARGVVYDFAEIVGDSIEADLERRDFTIGAIAVPLAPPHEIVDPFGGLRDLDGSTLRMVRESNFADDPLRVLRGARLVAELALEVDPETLDAMHRHAGQLDVSAPERLGVEWLALLSVSNEGALRSALALIRDLGLDVSLAGEAIAGSGLELAAKVRDTDAVTRLAAVALGTAEATLCASLLRLGVGASRVDAVRRASRLARLLEDAGERVAIDPVELFDAGEAAARRAIALLQAMGKSALAVALETLVAREGATIFGAKPILDGSEIGAVTGIAPGPMIGDLRRALLVAQLRGHVRDTTEARELVRRIVALGEGRGLSPEG